jgi:DNA modification methylase
MTVRILPGDCRDVLRTLPDESVHCVVTSPPYWGLRDYGIPPSVWGGDAACQHEWGEGLRRHKGGPHGNGLMREGGRSVVEAQASCKDIESGSFCRHCGAWRGAVGLEPTHQLYVDHAVEVFREVRRVLRADGSLWLNLGDCYANDGTWGGATGGKHTDYLHGQASRIGREKRRTGLKPKDLVGVPWRVAFALQEDGWWLRQDIIWHKPNPMPESISDRCTKAHEYVFLLTKSARYYYDAEAIKEPASDDTHPRGPGNKRHKGTDAYNAGDARQRTKAGLVTYAERRRVGVTPKSAPEGSMVRAKESWHASTVAVLEKRNKRSVWTVASQPFPDAHFAMFAPALIEPAILAGCPQGGTVLDPFGGAGTTGLVADRRQRNAILIERNPDYVAMAHRRIAADAPLFAHTKEAAE